MTDTPLQLDSFIPYRLSYTAGLVSEYVAGAYQAWFQIGIPEWRVLSWVAQSGEITQQYICARTRMDKVTVSRAAIALTARGLIAKRRNPGDKRSHLLALTADGKDLHARIAPRALELESRILARFDRAQLDGLVAMLREIDAAVLSLGETGMAG
ncbi:MarR family winged helix-turn-helix transcriptional regulator [Sphingomonas sp. IC081]|uniref:MarR family winged helix-turn-helix transcriptional regulator n=1 Tax=Sphingomonas sp. IC081 TaxID=304378 RepID=UPI001159AEA6|nr:MarR family winged helix-turn-helix transcriptional regulator [Sphingomonas sp. IC081]QDK35194.1 MarR family transcriptional regulator [Sphingomonas sp. IC081]